jgi:dipeptidase D
MGRVLSGLEPGAVFEYFEDLSRIPRESGNEKAVCEYVMDFAKKHGLEHIHDEFGNVVVKKAGTKGYEASEPVIIQGHLDMVCVKTEGSEHDFLTDPIELVIDGDLVRAKDTTLGADNGIAVAMAMAVLASDDVEHPPIEALFTVDEESGMYGAENLDGSVLAGKTLINIDSEEEGYLLASCAGGVRTVVRLPVEWEDAGVDAVGVAYKISVKGLQGGHSGTEIDKNRANAIKMLGRALSGIESLDCSIFHVDGGEKMNAIAKFADAYVTVDPRREADFLEALKAVDSDFKNELSVKDPGYTMAVEKIRGSEFAYDRAFSKKTRDAVVSVLRLIPNGVETMSGAIKGLVESSNNVGELRTRDGGVEFNCAVRSSVKSLKDEINGRILALAALTGASVEFVADYPAWEYKDESGIRDIMKAVWLELSGKDAIVNAIHAGLECGFLKERIGDIDMVSIGPDIKDAHTPLENLSISSTKRVYDFLVEVLKRLK